MKTHSHNLTRTEFIQYSLTGAASFFLPALSLAQTPQDKPAPLKGELVKEFVGVCHGNMVRAKEMLENEPLLLHASWDWGGGDFESGIEAAGHVGNKRLPRIYFQKARGTMSILRVCSAMRRRSSKFSPLIPDY